MKEKLALINKNGTIKCGELTVNVRILDFKRSYGHERYLVTPRSGEGQVWVETITIK